MAPSSNKLSTLLWSENPIILDGALATYLESLGADITTSLWSAHLLTSIPLLIYRTHADYFQAGAQIAITVSYQASIPGLTRHLHINEEQAKNLVKKSVELAKAAREDYLASLPASTKASKSEKLLVAGSVGPYGAYLADGSEYRGGYALSDDEFKTFHRGRINALVCAGVDVLALETIPSYTESLSLISLLTTEFPSTEAWLSFTVRSGTHLSDGTPLSCITAAVDECEQIVAVGVNCVQEDVALGATKTLAALTWKPLLVYPNSGESWNAEKRDWEGKKSRGGHLAARTKEFWDAGARIIGGCCRTDTDDIRVIAETLGDVKGKESAE